MIAARRPSPEVRVPTLLRIGPYRFLFHSREHDPPHIHVESSSGKDRYEISRGTILVDLAEGAAGIPAAVRSGAELLDRG